jgi:hypothetical protein
MRNVSDKSYRENQNVILCLVTFFPENRTVYKIMRENVGRARQATDVNIIRHMRTACWIPKAADTHTEYVILIAFPRRKWLHERATILLYTNIVYRKVLFTPTYALSHTTTY